METPACTPPGSLTRSGRSPRCSARRAALSDLIELLAPADATAPTEPDGTETWHSLADAGTPHEVFLVRRAVAGGGLALDLAVRGGMSAPSVALTFALGLVQADDSGLHPIVGAPGNPVRVRVDVAIDPATGAGFDGLVIEADLAPADSTDPVTLRVGVQGLRVGDQVGSGATSRGCRSSGSASTSRWSTTGSRPCSTRRRPAAGHQGRPGSPTWPGCSARTPIPAGLGTVADPWRIPLAILGDDGGIDLTLAVRTTAAPRGRRHRTS